jgi:predicted ATPase
MKIKSINIKKFRGFSGVEFKLGSLLTVIAGQNGTQKTTLLGILSQPFTVTDKSNPIKAERPLCGGNYKSAFSQKFKLSEEYDTAGKHEWTLSFKDEGQENFTAESIPRSKSSSEIRFWRKGTKGKGSGYIQLPVIFLSLSRLFPIGEDENIGNSDDVTLTNQEFDFFKHWHNKILITTGLDVQSADYLASSQKNTLGVNTNCYDWKMNSAGQDNIGKILLAVLSFKRLKENHKEAYSGGILAIDELDATLYPASQVKLLRALRKFASDYDLQIITTTHSLNILEKACSDQESVKLKGQTKVVFLKKVDDHIHALENITYEKIKNILQITLSPSRKKRKITTFTEDEECRIFLKGLVKQKASLDCVDIALGCNNLIDLSLRGVPGFKYPNSLIVLDGDVTPNKKQMRKVKKAKNIVVLPGEKSPETVIASFLHSLSDEDPIWESIADDYSKQFCFEEYSLEEIQRREVAKKWFNEQKEYWGRNCNKVINPWIKANKEEADDFLDQVLAMCEKLTRNAIK